MSVEQFDVVEKVLLVDNLLTSDALMTKTFMPLALISRHVLPTRQANRCVFILATAHSGYETAIFRAAIRHPNRHLSLLYDYSLSSLW